MISWMRGLFTKKATKKRKPYARLTKAIVLKAKEDIESHPRETIMGYYGISNNTYYAIKNGTHRHLRGDK